MKARGFTLLEIMIVVVIVGILATVSVNQYFASKENVADREVIPNLKMLQTAEVGYKLDMGTYYPDPAVAASVSDIMAINTNLSVALSNNANRIWDYKVYATGCVEATSKLYLAALEGTWYLPVAEASVGGPAYKKWHFHIIDTESASCGCE